MSKLQDGCHRSSHENNRTKLIGTWSVSFKSTLYSAASTSARASASLLFNGTATAGST